jgi:hypothetical protein
MKRPSSRPSRPAIHAVYCYWPLLFIFGSDAFNAYGQPLPGTGQLRFAHDFSNESQAGEDLTQHQRTVTQLKCIETLSITKQIVFKCPSSSKIQTSFQRCSKVFKCPSYSNQLHRA